MTKAEQKHQCNIPQRDHGSYANFECGSPWCSTLRGEECRIKQCNKKQRDGL